MPRPSRSWIVLPALLIAAFPAGRLSHHVDLQRVAPITATDLSASERRCPPYGPPSEPEEDRRGFSPVFNALSSLTAFPAIAWLPVALLAGDGLVELFHDLLDPREVFLGSDDHDLVRGLVRRDPRLGRGLVAETRRRLGRHRAHEELPQR